MATNWPRTFVIRTADTPLDPTGKTTLRGTAKELLVGRLLWPRWREVDTSKTGWKG